MYLFKLVGPDLFCHSNRKKEGLSTYCNIHDDHDDKVPYYETQT